MTHSTPPVSAVVPAWNAAATLARALTSIRSQTVQPAEVIVVDDGSTDDTAAIAASFGVRLLRHDCNSGGGAALHTGIEAARHDWVAVLDADDEWLPAKLEAQLDALAAAPDSAVVATAFHMISDGAVTRTYGVDPFPHIGREFWRNLLMDSAILQSSSLLRRRLVLAAGGIDRSLRTGYDQCLFLRLAALAPVAYLHEPLVRYHDTPGSITKVPRKEAAATVDALIGRHIAALSGRMTAAERRSVIGRRASWAAEDHIISGNWGAAVAKTLSAVAHGDRRAANSWRLLTNLPAIVAFKRAIDR